MAQRLLRWFLFAVVLCTLSCAKDTFAPSVAYDQWGPFEVGTAQEVVVTPLGVELIAQVWFPITLTYQEASTSPLHYYEGVASGEALAEKVPECSTPHPVFVFSHGHNGVRFQSIYLLEFLVSHGFIAIAPDHRFNTYYDADPTKLPEVLTRRPKDLSAAYDWLLEQSNQEDSPYFECVTPQEGYAVGGHSFGGYTALAAAGASIDLRAFATSCQTNEDFVCEAARISIATQPQPATSALLDPRIWATVPLSPAGYELFRNGLTKVTIPTLILSGERDTSTPLSSVLQIFDTLVTTPRYFGMFQNAGHVSFSNACDFTPNDFLECSTGYMPYQEVQEQSRTLTLSFLSFIRGENAAHRFLKAPSADVVFAAIE